MVRSGGSRLTSTVAWSVRSPARTTDQEVSIPAASSPRWTKPPSASSPKAVTTLTAAPRRARATQVLVVVPPGAAISSSTVDCSPAAG
jgi:hypothetical protein